MTLRDIETMTCDFLTVAQVAEATGRDAQMIRVQARKDPDKLGFPICQSGSRYTIPREGFLFWARYGRPIIQEAKP